MKTIYIKMKATYDDTNPNLIKTLSLPGNKQFKFPEKCIICNDTNTKMSPCDFKVKDLKMKEKIKLDLPYCGKHSNQLARYHLSLLVIYPLSFGLALYLLFRFMWNFDLASACIPVFFFALFLGGVTGLIISVVRELLKNIFGIKKVRGGLGLWGVRLFKAPESEQGEDSLINIGFQFYNDQFAEEYTVMDSTNDLYSTI